MGGALVMDRVAILVVLLLTLLSPLVYDMAAALGR